MIIIVREINLKAFLQTINWSMILQKLHDIFIDSTRVLILGMWK